MSAHEAGVGEPSEPVPDEEPGEGAGPRRRWALFVIVALLGAGLAVDRGVARPVAAGTVSIDRGPAAAPASARSSTWYCAGATATATVAAKGAVADGTVVIANAGRRTLRGTVTVVPVEGASRGAALTVDTATKTSVRLADVAAGAWASAVVELDGGQAVVELSVHGPLGDAVAPCASSPSSRWYFADGATSKDATEMLLVFNPFPEDALVDMAFSTEDGRLVPQALVGLAVNGGTMIAVNVGDHVRRRDQVAAEVTARVGRLIVERLQTFDGSAGRKGMALALGSAASHTWYFPEGLVADGLAEHYVIFNPSGREVSVELSLFLEQGEAEPIDVTVPPQSRVNVDSADEPRIPKLVPHAVTVHAGAGAGVVVERRIDANPPAPRLGVAITPGALVSARRWGVVSGLSDGVDEWLVIQNPGTRPARISVLGLVDGQRLGLDGLQGLVLRPGQRQGIRIGDHFKRQAAPLVVDSSVPIVVERDLYRVKGPGTVMSMGVPLSP